MNKKNRSIKELKDRKKSLFTSTISADKNGDLHILDKKLIDLVQENSFSFIVGSMFLGRNLRSKKTEEFIDLVLKLLVDHGPYVSGAVNTMISARAGKDLVSSLAAGLLTIGNRFGGAINGAAEVWFDGANNDQSPRKLVEDYAKAKKYIPGIGHRKYRIDLPDPRVKVIREQSSKLKNNKYLDFALKIEKITTSKKSNLILNVDGCIGAVLLDLLVSEEKLDGAQVRKLIETEFFNSLFVLARSVGFIAHFLDQKRLNEPLFRLEPKDVLYARQNE